MCSARAAERAAFRFKEDSMTTPPPQSPSRELDLGQGFRFFFEDPDWVKKILISGVFMLPVASWADLRGGIRRRLAAVVRGEPRPLRSGAARAVSDGLRAFGLYRCTSVASSPRRWAASSA
jgi:hypothetical protein